RGHPVCPAFFAHRHAALRVLHSLPTRRSSDLIARHLAEEQISLESIVQRRPNGSAHGGDDPGRAAPVPVITARIVAAMRAAVRPDRKSTRLNSSHVKISYAVFCLKKKKTHRAT